MGQQGADVVGAIDTVTGLPWSTLFYGDAVRLALLHDLHVVSIHLGGLAAVMDVHGPQTFVAVMRNITRRLRYLTDERDRLSRHAGDRLLLLTVRSPEAVARLVDAATAEIAAAGIEVEGERLPRAHIGVARLPRVHDRTEAMTKLDAAILSAEITASALRGAAAAGAARVAETAPRGPAAPPEPPAAAAVPPIPEEEHPMVWRSPEPAAPVADVERVMGRREKRVVLKGLRVDLTGLVATAIVELVRGDRHVVAKSVGRNVEERRLYLIGEATARAVTDFLPPGHGIVVHDVQVVQPGAQELGRGILASVLYLSPDNEQFLFGVTSAEGDVRLSAAKSVLSAVNRRIEPLLEDAPDAEHAVTG